MELLSAYIYSHAPMQLTLINPASLTSLKAHGWFDDDRVPDKFNILNKRFNVDGMWYRVVLRFRKTGAALELDTPIPFSIIQSELIESIGAWGEDETVFKDIRVWHGNTIKQTHNYIKEGVPRELINLVMDDLRNNLMYQNSTKKEKPTARPIELNLPDIDIDFNNMM